MSDGLPPGGDGATEDELADAGGSQAHEGGAPAGNGVDGAEASFERTGQSRRESRRIDQLLRERAELRGQLDATRTQRDAAIRAVRHSTAQSIDSDIAALTAQAEQAFLDGDAKTHTQAQTQLNALVARKEVLAAQPLPQQGAAAPPTVSAETQDWIDRNPRFRTDPAWGGEAMKAHRAAMALELAPDTADYFEFVEQQIERRFPGTVNRTEGGQQIEEQSVQSTQQQQQTPSRPGYRGPAPVGRAALPGRPGPATRTVDVIPANMLARVDEFAKASGQTRAEYWASARSLAAAGKMNLDSLKA